MHNKTEQETVQIRHLSVGFYALDTDPSLQDKITQLKFFLTQHGGECQVITSQVNLKDANLQVEFLADIPAWFVDQHHSFDSKLNNSVDGFGVAWVEER